ncbi:MAG: HAD-IC family P-type ATPase, partial [Clostridiales bacterium]
IGIEEIADNLEQKQCQSGINKRLYWQAAISGILFLVAILGSQVFQQQVFYFLLPVVALVGGWFNFKKGFLNLISWRFDTSVLMSLAVVGAFAINQWEEAALLAFLFAIAEILESYTANRARQSIAQLIDEQPEKALLLTEAGEKEIAAKDVLPGQILLLRAGEKVPVDALVVEGNSYIQQSAITGEPLPREVAPGDKLYSGSLNEQGVLKIEALEKAQDSTMSKIIQLVEEAQGHKSQFQGMIERFAAIYTPIVLVLAIIVALIPPLFLGDWLAWIYRGLTLLVISCPCALVITSPVVLVSAISNGARNGILIKGGNYLERLAGVKIAAFDKTGTLSLGKPQVEAVLNYDFDEKEALSLALALEKSSKHPLAEALRQYCHDEGILEDDSLLDLQNIPGKGT